MNKDVMMLNECECDVCVKRVSCKASVMSLIYIADFSGYMLGTVLKSNVVWQP